MISKCTETSQTNENVKQTILKWKNDTNADAFAVHSQISKTVLFAEYLLFSENLKSSTKLKLGFLTFTFMRNWVDFFSRKNAEKQMCNFYVTFTKSDEIPVRLCITHS